MKNNVANVSQEVIKIHQSALEKTFKIIIRTIKESTDIDYDPLDILLKDHDGYRHESFVGIIIFECYALLQIIKKHDITEDNYNSKQAKFNNAVKNIEELSAKEFKISMLPRASRVLYILKYYLFHHFEIDKDTTKHILDEIADRDPINSRMPKNNEDLNEEIKLSNEINDYKFDTTEGQGKWQYFNLSIFTIKEFREFRNIIYDDDLLHEIADEEFAAK